MLNVYNLVMGKDDSLTVIRKLFKLINTAVFEKDGYTSDNEFYDSKLRRLGPFGWAIKSKHLEILIFEYDDEDRITIRLNKETDFYKKLMEVIK